MKDEKSISAISKIKTKDLEAKLTKTKREIDQHVSNLTTQTAQQWKQSEIIEGKADQIEFKNKKIHDLQVRLINENSQYLSLEGKILYFEEILRTEEIVSNEEHQKIQIELSEKNEELVEMTIGMFLEKEETLKSVKFI